MALGPTLHLGYYYVHPVLQISGSEVYHDLILIMKNLFYTCSLFVQNVNKSFKLGIIPHIMDMVKIIIRYVLGGGGGGGGGVKLN